MKFLYVLSALLVVCESHNHHHQHDGGHHHHHDHHHRHRHEKHLPEYATKAASLLEKAYVEDCKADMTPHGYYGAVLQPCEFKFFASKKDKNSNLRLNSYYNSEEEDSDKSSFDPFKSCDARYSDIVGSPVPLNWVLNLTSHYEKDDWEDAFSSDDFEDFDTIAEKLLLWPDQCVGTMTRCYSVNDSGMMIRDRLEGLFADGDGIPQDAEFVSVNCQADSVAAARVVYAFADGFEKSTPTIIAWMVTVVLAALVLSLWSCVACFRLCLWAAAGGRREQPKAAEARIVQDNHGAVYHPVKDKDDADADEEAVSALKAKLVE